MWVMNQFKQNGAISLECYPFTSSTKAKYLQIILYGKFIYNMDEIIEKAQIAHEKNPMIKTWSLSPKLLDILAHDSVSVVFWIYLLVEKFYRKLDRIQRNIAENYTEFREMFV